MKTAQDLIRDTLGDLMIRIAVLEAENLALKAQLAEKPLPRAGAAREVVPTDREELAREPLPRSSAGQNGSTVRAGADRPPAGLTRGQK